MSTKEQGGLSRRSFLKGAGVAAAAVAGSAALAGCASGSTGAASGDWLPKSWDYECDLLVIGYGGAGMWASLIGADECGQEVIVLESGPSSRKAIKSSSRSTSRRSRTARPPSR